MRKIEHKVNAETAEFARKALEQLMESRKLQLTKLGEVYELNNQMSSINQALEAMAVMTAVHDKLPPANYRFTPDGTTLIAQIDVKDEEE